MKALLSYHPGPPESLVLEEVPDPVPGPDEVLIRVVACGVNFPDVLLVAGKYQFRPPRPFSPGAEVAGIVEQVGAEVTRFAPGDRVMALCSWGGMAEKLAVSEAKCVAVPGTMPLDQAAALELTYGTAHHALVSPGELKEGETVLVLGAAGGVGLAAVELAKAMGARVLAAVSSPEKALAAREAGADEAFLYPRGPFDKEGRRELGRQLRAAAGGGADVVIDPVGGDYSEAALRAMRPGGRLVVVGFAAGIPQLPLNLVLFGEAKIVAGAWGAVVARDPACFRQTIGELSSLHARGLIRPRISRRFPLGQAPDALAMLERREAVGKIVIEIGAE